MPDPDPGADLVRLKDADDPPSGPNSLSLRVSSGRPCSPAWPWPPSLTYVNAPASDALRLVASQIETMAMQKKSSTPLRSSAKAATPAELTQAPKRPAKGPRGHDVVSALYAEHRYAARLLDRHVLAHCADVVAHSRRDAGIVGTAALLEALQRGKQALSGRADRSMRTRDLVDARREIGIAYDDAMLHWAAGRRDSDGVWAPAWYDAVERSTGFERPKSREVVRLGSELQRIADAARSHYEVLAKYKFR